jgi:hypothetical protein
MSPLEQRLQQWEARLSRCRELADRLRGDDGGDRLAVVAVEIQQQMREIAEGTLTVAHEMRRSAAMLAEMNQVITRTRHALLLSREHRIAFRFGADDLREEARVCREEAEASDDISSRQTFAARAFELAQLGEAIHRCQEEIALLKDPGKLRERSRIALRTAGNAVDAVAKQRLNAAAMVLAQVADAVERGDAAAVKRLEAQLANALAAVPTETQIDPDQPADRVLAERIKRWRMRAAELHAAADQFVIPSAQERLRGTATYYERLADQAEAKLSGKPAAPTEEAG